MSEVIRQEAITIGTPATSPGADEYIQLLGPSGSRLIKATDIDDFDGNDTVLTGTTTAERLAVSKSIGLGVVTQNAHGFSNGDAVRKSGITWVKAIATSKESATVQAVVQEATTNTFLPVQSGRITGVFSVGDYHLSDTVAGAVTQVELTDPESWKTRVLVAVSTTEAYIMIGEPLTLSQIPTSAIADVITSLTGESATHDRLATSLAIITYLASQLDGLEIPAEQVSELSEGKLIIGGADGKGLQLTVGAGLTITHPSGVATISATAGGANTPVPLSGDVIDWTEGLNRTRVLSTDPTFSFANVINGSQVNLWLTANGDDITPIWPPNVSWGAASAPTILDGETYEIHLKPWGSFVRASNGEGSPHVLDLAPPTVSSAIVTTDVGDTAEIITLTFSKTVTGPTTGNNGFTLSLSGGPTTVSYSSGEGGATRTFALGRRIDSSEVLTIAYSPGTVVATINEQPLAAFSGTAVTNNSAHSAYDIFAWDSESGTLPAAISVVSGNCYANHTPSLAGTYSIAFDGVIEIDLGSDRTIVEGFWHSKHVGNTTATVVELRNSSNVTQASWEARSDRVQRAHGSVGGGAPPYSNYGANRAVTWWKYTANTGAGTTEDPNNGQLRHWINFNSPDETKPAVFSSGITTGTGGAIRKIRLLSPLTTGDGLYIYAKIRLATSEIPSNPV